ncbi:MAG: phosphonoacetaldehyde hydrolase [Gammaproteobacteria bacterium]
MKPGHSGGYRGPVRAAIFDWAGTVVDCGSRAPVQAFVEAFAGFGVTLGEADVRRFMGLSKRDHILALAAMPSVASAWRARHGCGVSEDDVQRLHDAFTRLQSETVARFAEPIAGVLPAIAALRERGIRIGSTSGYPRSVMQALLPAAAGHGYAPEHVICEDDVPRGRPAPYMALKSMVALDVWPVAACIKVDDTPAGVEAGRNAGMWAVGVAMTGNQVGLDPDQLARLNDAERAALQAGAVRALGAAGAHFVIDSAADVLTVVERIEQRLAAGERP